MRKIQFVSLHGQDEVDTPDVGLLFKNGEIKDVQDAVAKVLLTNRNFVDVTLQQSPLSSLPTSASNAQLTTISRTE